MHMKWKAIIQLREVRVKCLLHAFLCLDENLDLLVFQALGHNQGIGRLFSRQGRKARNGTSYDFQRMDNGRMCEATTWIPIYNGNKRE